MKIDRPAPPHTKQQRTLWQDAFGDTDGFLDSFFRTAYSPDRCRCVLVDDEIAAILYWIDCTLEAQRLAYIYAVVTRPDHRGKGLCRKLMEDTHALLAQRGYSGALLVPQKESLRQMYAGMGYRNIGGLAEFRCQAGSTPLPLRAVGPEEYAALRRSLLPPDSVIQEGAGLAFLAEQLQFYAGQDVLLAAYAENKTLFVPELLGHPENAPGILRELGVIQGIFRTPGIQKPFAMYHSLREPAVFPGHFGFAFD